MDQRTMIYWAACIDSTLYLVGVFVLGMWLNHPLACIMAVATKGVSYLGDWAQAIAMLDNKFDRLFRWITYSTVALGVLAGVLAI